MFTRGLTALAVACAAWASLAVAAEPVRLESPALQLEVDPASGAFALLDRAASVRWPAEGRCAPGVGLEGAPFTDVKATPASLRLARPDGTALVYDLVDDGRSVELRYELPDGRELRVLAEALRLPPAPDASLIVPCREGLLIPAASPTKFAQTFGTSDYEGCHMNMLGLLRQGAGLIVSWDSASVWADVRRTVAPDEPGDPALSASLRLRGPARLVRLTPLGQGDINALAAGYRRLAERKGLAVTMRQRIERNAHAELLLGASNVKLWTCLARRRNEESTADESVKVRWTFDEAARIAEHLKNDLGIDRTLFTLGGWTEGGYDVRHPDALPANPECGGNDALADAVRRIQALGYVASLHDNYQDMYRDAPSWNPALLEKAPDGAVVKGGRWLGGRAYMVCAPNQLALATRPQNLPEINRLFGPWSYFIDTTYAVGPRECFDPAHPIGRDDDVAWKIRLSDAARATFGLFGSECGREWALPHSDFFEGLTGVAGKDFHNLDPATLDARVIPFWEMVYHDCQVAHGKYGYPADRAAGYVARHVLAARPLHHHSIPDHLYWQDRVEGSPPTGDAAAYVRADRGWAEGLHPTDVFLKTTHEVLGPLNRATAFDRLTRLEFLSPDGTLRRATYGEGDAATTIVVNLGPEPAPVDMHLGGNILLPPFGFAAESPRFAAFHARRWNGLDYPEGALFTLQAVDGMSLADAPRIRVFHAFGDPHLRLHNRDVEVAREQVVDLATP